MWRDKTEKALSNCGILFARSKDGGIDWIESDPKEMKDMSWSEGWMYFSDVCLALRSIDAVTSAGVARIAAERKRQIQVEGWTPEHDMQHSFQDLATAGVCYALTVATSNKDITSMMWPWAAEWWKPSPDPVRNLEKAGALIAAAIDRIQMEDK